MQGNGHRPKRAGKPVGGENLQSAGDKKTSAPAPRSSEPPSEEIRQHHRVLRLAREKDEDKVGSDIVATVIIILAVGLASWGAYILWTALLSQPTRH